jgi:D-serine deaminase-like pyridoxal phosphate-dependent protein
LFVLDQKESQYKVKQMKKKNPYPSIDTPAVIIDLAILERNIKDITQLASEAGVKLRPHVKIHQCPDIARMQLEAGACGIEVGLVDQAIVMAEAGLDDIIVVHPFFGERKFEKVRKLIKKPNLKLGIVVDMIEQAQELSKIGESVGKKIQVLMKIDTGGRRYGVLPGMPAIKLAEQLDKLPGIELAGLYAHESGAEPTDEGVARIALEIGTIMSDMARTLRREGFDINHVSVGASPTFLDTCRYIKEGLLNEITEIHPGGRFIGDITYLTAHGNTREQCALTIITTVVSTSHPTHVIIDAGLKTFGSASITPLYGRQNSSNLLWHGMPSYGSVKGREDLWLGRLHAESGRLYYKDSEDKNKLCLGDRIEIIPHNATIVLNLHEKAYGVRNHIIEREFTITGRGHGS